MGYEDDDDLDDEILRGNMDRADAMTCRTKPERRHESCCSSRKCKVRMTTDQCVAENLTSSS